MRYLLAICCALFLVACGDEGTSEPIQYPREISVETYSSMAESSEMQSSSSASFLCVIGTGEDCEYGTLIDERDGHTYKTMKIGGQEWMAENLNYQIGIKNCYHDSCAVYGQRYSWKTAMDSAGTFSTNGIGCGFGQMCSPDYPVRGICPAGWHLPSNFEIEPMTFELGRLREFAAQGEDSSTEVQFVKQFLTHLEFWSSTEENWHSAPFLTCGEESCSLFPATCLKKNNINVRCVKGKNAEQNMDKLLSSSSQSSSSSEIKSSSSSSFFISYGEMTDERDGQTYKTMTIEGKFVDCLNYSPMGQLTRNVSRTTWMAENLNYAYLQPTSSLDSSSRCYGNDPALCEKYGRQYLWSAAMDSAALFSETSKGCGNFATKEEWYKCPVENGVRGVCPEGWRLPTYNEDYAIALWRICMEPEGFNQNQTPNYFWLARDSWYSRAKLDACDPYDLAWSEGYGIDGEAIVEADKNAFFSVRCVKDIP